MIKQKLSSYAENFEEKLERAFKSDKTEYDVIYEGCRYSLLLGGKRIRPYLLNSFFGLCGGEGNRSLNFEFAIECIHTYSLVHDDLPSMDNDDMRRGKPSCHIRFGEANALLVGDALLTKAFSFASKTDDIKAENVLKATNMRAEYAGVDGMIGGQAVDLLYEGRPADEKLLRLICDLKTGALIKAACKIGTVLAGAEEEKLKAAELYAEYLGLAFQIVDDILDIVGDEQKLGKPINSDAENEKTTFVVLFGIEKCKQLVQELTDRAKASLDIFGAKADDLKALADYLCKRDY